ncbi:type II secretion system protein GspD [Candidatus Margulisiibacteriota bacterium]
MYKNTVAMVLLVMICSAILCFAQPAILVSPETVVPGGYLTLSMSVRPDMQSSKIIWPDGTEQDLVQANKIWTAEWKVPEHLLDGDFLAQVIIHYLKGNHKYTKSIPVNIKIRKESETPVTILKKQKTEKTINLNLRNVELTQVLKLFAKQGQLNILADQTVKGPISFSASSIPIMEALDMVLKANGYSWTRNNDNIIVSLKKPSKTFILNYVKASNAQRSLRDLLPGVVGVSIDDRLNSVTVRGNLADLEEASIIINNIDIRPLQVLVEARVIEINAQDSPFLGMGLKYSNIRGNSESSAELKGLANLSTDSTATKGFFALLMDNNIQAWLEALQTDVHTDLLANTKILATNNKPARIITGEKLGYHVRQFTDTSTIESVEFLRVGTQLEFTPRIARDGYITMKIAPEVSEGAIVNDLPQETTTEVETEVTVRDGQSIIIGGLIRNRKTKTVNGIPYLKDIPGFGNLFRSTSILTEKKETIVVITPHIIYDTRSSKIQYVETTKKVEGGLWE